MRSEDDDMNMNKNNKELISHKYYLKINISYRKE